MAGEIRHLFAQWYKQSGQIAPVRIRGLNRRRLIQILGEHDLAQGAEIGVDRGRFSEYMLTTIPNLHLFLVDPWYWKLRGESRYKSTRDRMEVFGSRADIIRKTSWEALSDVPDESLDFVYIDGDHRFDAVMTDLIWWSQKVKYGGVVAGHDYYRFRHGGVVAAVDIYTRQHGIAEWFVTDTVKTSDPTPSFFWVREENVFDMTKDQD